MAILPFVVFILIAGVKGESSPLECTPLEIGECFAQIDIDPKDKGDDLLPNEAFLDKYCSSLISATRCEIAWLETCSSDDYLNEIVSISLEALNELCDTNSEIRQAYLASAPCINANKDKYLQCTQKSSRATQGFLEYMREKKYDDEEIDRVHKCYNILYGSLCFLMQTRKNCEENVANTVSNMVNTFFDKIEEEMCPDELLEKYVEEFIAYAIQNPEEDGENLMSMLSRKK